MSIETELIALKDTDDLLRVEKVHAWAKDNKGSSLHGAIDWDLARCAFNNQLDQIRRLIRVHIVYEDQTPRTINLKIDRVNGGGYRMLDDVIPSVDLRARMITEALAEIERVKKRYSAIEELCRVWDAAQEVKEQIERPRRRAGRR